MVSDEVGRKLHDRASRGETLSAEEQAQLEKWYALQDQAEAEVLGLTGLTDTVAALQAQIESALAQLAAVTQHCDADCRNELYRNLCDD